MIKSKLARYAPFLATPVALFGPLVAHAQEDWTASTTAAVTAGQSAIAGLFFTILPYALGGVVAVTLTLWAIRWVLSLFHGKRK